MKHEIHINSSDLEGKRELRVDCPECSLEDPRKAKEFVIYNNPEGPKPVCHRCKRKGKSVFFEVILDGMKGATVKTVAPVGPQQDGPKMAQALYAVSTPVKSLGGYFKSKGFRGQTAEMLKDHEDIRELPADWFDKLSEEDVKEFSESKIRAIQFRSEFPGTQVVFYRDIFGEITTFQMINNSNIAHPKYSYDFGGDNCESKYTLAKPGSNLTLLRFKPRGDWKVDPSRTPPETNTVFLCEGIATGVAIWEFLEMKYEVICAMTSGGVRKAAPELLESTRSNDKTLVNAADNDWYRPTTFNTDGSVASQGGPKAIYENTGVQLAFDLYANYQIDFVYPEEEWTKGGDWDDIRRESKEIQKLAIEKLRAFCDSPFDFGPFKQEKREVSLQEMRKLTKQKTEEFLGDILDSFNVEDFDGNNGAITKPIVRVLDQPPGTGKTEAALTTIVEAKLENPEIHAEVWAHTHEQAEELKNRLSGILQDKDANHLTVKRIKGMNSQDCLEPTISSQLAELEDNDKSHGHFQNIKKYCAICPYRSQCSIKKSERDAKKADFVVTTHARGRISETVEDPKYTVVYIDEDPMEGFMSDTKVLEEGKPLQLRGKVHADINKLSVDCSTELFSLDDGVYTQGNFTPSNNILELTEAFIEVNQEWSKRYNEVKKECLNKPARAFYKALADNGVSKYPPVDPGFYTKLSKGATFLKQNGIIILKAKIGPQRHSKFAGYLVSDAMATPEIYAKVFPYSDIKIWSDTTCPIADNVSAIQITDINTKGNEAVVQAIADRTDSESLGVISTKKNLEPFKKAFTMNFRCQYGTNSMENFEELYVIGWSHPGELNISNLSFHLFEQNPLDTVWTVAEEDVLGEMRKRRIPTDSATQLVYNQLIRKPAYHAIQRQRLHVPKDFARSLVFIADYFVADFLELSKGNDNGLPTNLNDTSEGQRNSAFAWIDKIVSAVESAGSEGIKATFSEVAKAVNAPRKTLVNRWVTKEAMLKDLENHGLVLCNRGKPSRPTWFLVKK